MMEIKYIIQPVIALVTLTWTVAVALYFTRIPAMKRLKIHPQKAQDTTELKKLLPIEVNRVSNNYNNLFEQPTVFYALALSIALLGTVDSFNVTCAWLYVGLRVLHSIVQTTVDKVMIRFLLFITSWLVLTALLFQQLWLLFFN